MKKLSIAAAAFALAVSAVPVALTQAQAAPAASPYCNIGFQKWNTNWAQYYHCYGSEAAAPRLVHHVARRVEGREKSPFCNIGFEKWNLNWQQYYHCF